MNLSVQNRFLTVKLSRDNMSSSRTRVVMKQAARNPLEEAPLYPTADLRRCARSRAHFLIHGYYTALYGAEIQQQSPVQIRLEIRAMQQTMLSTEDQSIKRGLVRTIRDYERICALQELLR